LYTLSEELAWEVDRLDSLQKGLEKIQSLVKDKKLVKKFGPENRLNALNTLRKKMVVTTGDNYVGTAEPELREKISGLYGEIASYAGKPSNAQLRNLSELDAFLKTIQAECNALVTDTNSAIETQLQKRFPESLIRYRTKEEFLKAD